VGKTQARLAELDGPHEDCWVSGDMLREATASIMRRRSGVIYKAVTSRAASSLA